MTTSEIFNRANQNILKHFLYDVNKAIEDSMPTLAYEIDQNDPILINH